MQEGQGARRKGVHQRGASAERLTEMWTADTWAPPGPLAFWILISFIHCFLTPWHWGPSPTYICSDLHSCLMSVSAVTLRSASGSPALRAHAYTRLSPWRSRPAPPWPTAATWGRGPAVPPLFLQAPSFGFPVGGQEAAVPGRNGLIPSVPSGPHWPGV